jgi:glycosyltransferase involved in cell wall biosynthesis
MCMPKNLKILLPVGFFYPAENGGPALTLYWIAKSLVKLNVEVTVITTANGIEGDLVTNNQWLETEAGKVMYLETGNPNYSLRYIFFALNNFKNKDIVVITSMFALSSLLFVVYGRALNKKIIISPRGELDPNALVYRQLIKKIIIVIYNLLPSQNIHYHVTSDMEYCYFRKSINSKFRVKIIPNYISLPEKVVRSPKVDYLLYIGRFHAKKAIENLIFAVSNSNMFRNSKFQLLLAGNNKNAYGKEMIKIVNNLNLHHKIKFIGEIKKNEKEELYANAYVTIVPSHTENFGNVVIESLSQSTPVIASTGTPWKQLNDHRIGSWVCNEPEFLRKSIEEIIELDAIEYCEMRKRCRPFVEKEFDIKKGVHKWIELFESLLLK